MAIVLAIILAPFIWYAICFAYGALSTLFALGKAGYQDLTEKPPELPPPTKAEIDLYYLTRGRQGRLPGPESKFGPGPFRK